MNVRKISKLAVRCVMMLGFTSDFPPSSWGAFQPRYKKENNKK